MVGITVQEAFEAALPAGAVLLGGGAGLGRTIAGAATMRARTPAFTTLRGGEVALVSVSLARQVQAHPRFDQLVAQLAGADVAAVVFLDVVRAEDTFGADAPAVACAADRHGVAVFAVPPPYAAEAIELALHRLLAGRREAHFRRSQELQQVFANLALSGQGPEAIVERLARTTGLAAVWEDAAGEVRTLAPPPGGLGALAELSPDLPALVRSATLPLQRWRNTLPPAGTSEPAVLPLRADTAGKATGWQRLVVPFSVAGHVAGFLSVFAPGGLETSEVRLALGAAGLAASIEALRTSTASEAR